jgi:hypothetical protein
MPNYIEQLVGGDTGTRSIRWKTDHGWLKLPN